MKNYEIDILYQLACLGDEEAYKSLFNQYLAHSFLFVQEVLGKIGYSNISPADFPEITTDLFFGIIRTYDPKIRRFKNYCNFVLERRVKDVILSKIDTDLVKPISLDSSIDKRPLYDLIEDKSIKPIPDDVASSNAILEISSPKNKNGKLDRQRSKVNMMLIAGYSKEEVRKSLNLTRSQLRTIEEKNKNDKSLQNLKIELK